MTGTSGRCRGWGRMRGPRSRSARARVRAVQGLTAEAVALFTPEQLARLAVLRQQIARGAYADDRHPDGRPAAELPAERTLDAVFLWINALGIVVAILIGALGGPLR